MMRKRRKQYPGLYPDWMRKQESPSKLAKIRDGNRCVDCQVEDRIIAINAEGQPYMLYLHGAHVHDLDPDPVVPIAGQSLRARCPRCHRLYDLKWEERAQKVEQQCRMHQTLINCHFVLGRFMCQV